MNDFSCGLDVGSKREKKVYLEPFQTLLRWQLGDGEWQGLQQREDTQNMPPRDWLREQWPSKWKATKKRTRSKHLLESERKFIRDRFSHQSSKNMTVCRLFSHPSPYSSPVFSNTTNRGRWIKTADVSQPLPTSRIWSSNCRLHKKQKGSEIGTLTKEWNIGANLWQNARFVTWWSI